MSDALSGTGAGYFRVRNNGTKSSSANGANTPAEHPPPLPLLPPPVTVGAFVTVGVTVGAIVAVGVGAAPPLMVHVIVSPPAEIFVIETPDAAAFPLSEAVGDVA